jgi:hypothetical protein
VTTVAFTELPFEAAISLLDAIEDTEDNFSRRVDS